MPKRIKTHASPGKLTRKEQNAIYDAKRNAENEWRAWYGSPRWKALRLIIMARFPWCVRCDLKDIATPSTTANHIKPHKGDPLLFWDEANLEGVCAPCHSADIQREEHAAGYHKQGKD